MLSKGYTSDLDKIKYREALNERLRGVKQGHRGGVNEKQRALREERDRVSLKSRRKKNKTETVRKDWGTGTEKMNEPACESKHTKLNGNPWNTQFAV